MEFEVIDLTAIDIKQAWVATNACQQVHLIQNRLDNWEIWVDGEYVDQYADREYAIRNVECKVAFRVPAGEILYSSEG